MSDVANNDTEYIEHKSRPKKSTQLVLIPCKWFGSAELPGYVADMIQAEANRRNVRAPELIADILYYVATSDLYEAVIDGQPLGPKIAPS